MQAQSFRASRFRSRTTTPRVKASVRRFEEYKELLAPLMAFVSDRGRLPTADEIQPFTSLQIEFGTLRKAFQVVLQVTNSQEWDSISDKRRQDLLVYLALSHFSRRPKLREFSSIVQNDIKSLFGGYQQACAAADLMLLSLGNPEIMGTRCQISPVGKKISNSLWVHVSAIEALDPCCDFMKVARLARSVVPKRQMSSSSISASPKFLTWSTQNLIPILILPCPQVCKSICGICTSAIATMIQTIIHPYCTRRIC